MTGIKARITKRKHFLAALGAVAVLAVSGAVFSSGNLRSSVVSVDTSTYQAVHVDTGKTYYGKVVKMKKDFITMMDVFYFLDGSQKKLVKKTDDSLVINQEHVVATENLSTDNPVVKAILKYHKNKN